MAVASGVKQAPMHLHTEDGLLHQIVVERLHSITLIIIKTFTT